MNEMVLQALRKVPQLPQTVPLAGDQLFKHVSLWGGAFPIETTAVPRLI